MLQFGIGSVVFLGGTVAALSHFGATWESAALGTLALMVGAKIAK